LGAFFGPFNAQLKALILTSGVKLMSKGGADPVLF
jgi:hypothetical protein